MLSCFIKSSATGHKSLDIGADYSVKANIAGICTKDLVDDTQNIVVYRNTQLRLKRCDTAASPIQGYLKNKTINNTNDIFQFQAHSKSTFYLLSITVSIFCGIRFVTTTQLK
jgi:hypothetical protein